MKILNYLLFVLSTISVAQSQLTISGHISSMANTEVVLKGFSTNDLLQLAKGKTDSNGNFLLSYSSDYVGAALLEIDHTKRVIVLLNRENFKLEWKDVNTMSSLQFFNSQENKSFDLGLSLYQNTESKKGGISYLIPFYSKEPQKQKFLIDEMAFLNNEMSHFLKNISEKQYVSYYLKIRILIANLPLYASKYFNRLPELEKSFYELDFSDERLIHSGLYFELLDAFVTAMESYGDQQYVQLNKAIDRMLTSLKKNPTLAQHVTEYLFNLLERRSLFKASEHLALSMLSDDNCQLDDKHKALFEQYRKMAIGNTAPNIVFQNSKQSVQQLFDSKSKYKLVVFGASWCPKCNEELPEMYSFYQKWKKNNGVEIIFVSLDTQQSDYENFIKDFPWISCCDFGGWESKAAIDYSVFGTPSIYVLDSKNTIILKPVSLAQIDTWLSYQ